VLEEARQLVIFLLEDYVWELERSQRGQAYEAYYAVRAPEDETDEQEMLADFAFADAEINGETIP